MAIRSRVAKRGTCRKSFRGSVSTAIDINCAVIVEAIDVRVFSVTRQVLQGDIGSEGSENL